jgi:hypothetical protein
MASVSTRQWTAVETWSAMVFLVAGGFSTIHAGHHALEAFTAFEYPLHHELPFGLIGMILGFVGLLGLYPALAERMPTLAGAGGIIAGLGLVGWLVIGGQAVAEELGASVPEWLGAVAILVIGGVVLGYLTFSVASLRTDVLSRTTALVLLIPVVIMGFNVVVATAGFGSPAGQVIVSGGFALGHLAIGTALRTEYGPNDRLAPAPESTA